MEELDEKKSILIIDDDENICRTLTLIFNKIDYHVETAKTGNKALEKIRERFFNIALIDIKLPDIEGIELISPFKKKHPNIELIMITGQGSMETAISAIDEGASYYVTKPLNMDDVLVKIKKLFQKQSLNISNLTKPKIIENQRILIVDDDINICKSLSLIFKKKGFEVETAGTGKEALEKAQARYYNVALLDLKLPDINGLELLKPLKNMHPDMEVMMVTGYGSMESAMHALNLGASSYITKPLNMDEVLGKINDKLEKQSLTLAKRKAEKALRDSEEKYRKLFESNIDGISHVDMEGKFLDCNQAFLDMVGYSMEEIKEMNFQHLTPQKWSKEDENAITQIMTKGYCDEYEKEFIRKDGTLFPFNLKGWVIRDEKEVPTGMWAIIRDITERKKAEQKLKESEEKYRKIIENTKDGYFEVDLRGNFTFCNDALCKLFEYPPEELIGMNYKRCTTEETCKKAFITLNTIYKTGIEQKNFEYELITKNNKIRYGETTVQLRYDSKGKKVGFSGFIRDMTEKKMAEQELEKMMEELRRSNEELEQFAYVASHDLQEPLRMVASFTQLLQKRYQDKLDQDANDFINFAVDGATRMQGLINDLLIVSRVGTRGKPFKATDMNVILQDVLNNVSRSIKETNATITNDPLQIIIADDTQMIQLFQNLISNAIKFSGEESPRIHVSGEVKENEWVFSVSDNGIGIDSKYFDRIFIIFQRLHKKEEYGGTGIGLSVCKKIVQRHGGKIWVESELGKGSTFYFSIPRISLKE
jgi:PAS domain S-box-containing protein